MLTGLSREDHKKFQSALSNASLSPYQRRKAAGLFLLIMVFALSYASFKNVLDLHVVQQELINRFCGYRIMF